MCAWPYDAVDTVPSSATATTCGLSEVQVTPVAGLMMTPASSAKFAFSGYRRLSGRPSRAAESFKPAAMTRICHVTTSPGPGPLTTRVVFPARFPVSVPDAGSKLASDVSPTVQRNGASGTGLLAAALGRHHHMERVDVSRRHDEGNRLLDRDIALLHDHRRRRGEAARARDLHRSLAGGERDDHAVLVHARNVRAE